MRAVLAESFERIHRSNLVGMGVLPLQYLPGESAASLGLDGRERFAIALPADLRPRQEVEVTATGGDGTVKTFRALVRIDTPIEVEYYRHGGILPYVLRQMMKQPPPASAPPVSDRRRLRGGPAAAPPTNPAATDPPIPRLGRSESGLAPRRAPASNAHVASGYGPARAPRIRPIPGSAAAAGRDR